MNQYENLFENFMNAIERELLLSRNNNVIPTRTTTLQNTTEGNSVVYPSPQADPDIDSAPSLQRHHIFDICLNIYRSSIFPAEGSLHRETTEGQDMSGEFVSAPVAETAPNDDTSDPIVNDPYFNLYDNFFYNYHRNIREYQNSIQQYNRNIQQYQITIQRQLSTISNYIRQHPIRTSDSDASISAAATPPLGTTDGQRRNRTNIRNDRFYTYVLYTPLTGELAGTADENTNNRERLTISQVYEATTEMTYHRSENTVTVCPISLDEFQEGDHIVKIRYCGHIFMPIALYSWLNINSHCPVCRYDLRLYPPTSSLLHNTRLLPSNLSILRENTLNREV